MELYITEEGKRSRSMYYETNEIENFRNVVNFLKNYTQLDYDCEFSQYSIEIPAFGIIVKTILLSVFVFCLLLPATISLNDKRAKMSLPKYKMIIVPSALYQQEGLVQTTDHIGAIFENVGWNY